MEIIIIVLSCSSIVEVLSTTCLRRIMFIQIIDEEKRNHSWLFAWFRVTRLGHRKPLLKGSASRSFSETVTYNWQMTLTCLSPSSICNDFICTRGHQLLWLREQNKHSCFHLCKYGNHSAMSFSLFCFLNLVPLKWSWKVTAVVAEVS